MTSYDNDNSPMMFLLLILPLLAWWMMSMNDIAEEGDDDPAATPTPLVIPAMPAALANGGICHYATSTSGGSEQFWGGEYHWFAPTERVVLDADEETARLAIAVYDAGAVSHIWRPIRLKRAFDALKAHCEDTSE